MGRSRSASGDRILRQRGAGQEVVVTIGNVPRGPNDRPQKHVVLNEVVISRGKP